MISIEVSYGELFDKISILEIKKAKLINSNDIEKVIFELSLLTSALSKLNINNHDIDKLFNELNKVNLKLWEIEDLSKRKKNGLVLLMKNL